MALKKHTIFYSIIFFLISIDTIAQNPIILWGTVDSIPNVNIRIHETNYGTTTNERGLYSLPVYYSNQPIEIHFSSIGYQDTIIPIDLAKAKNDSCLQIFYNNNDTSIYVIDRFSAKDFYKS